MSGLRRYRLSGSWELRTMRSGGEPVCYLSRVGPARAGAPPLWIASPVFRGRWRKLRALAWWITEAR